MVDILFVTMETGGLAEKVQYIFYSVRPILYFLQKNCTICTKKNLSYLPAMCGLKVVNYLHFPVHKTKVLVDTHSVQEKQGATMEAIHQFHNSTEL